jgi:hypothetical protein
MIRVLGDATGSGLAERLSDANIDARFAGDPTGTVNVTDTASDADLLVGDVMRSLRTCRRIKKVAQGRAVVAVVSREFERLVAVKVRRAGGPDAYVVWPCTGDALKTALAQARARAGNPRPRLLIGELAWLLLNVTGLLLMLAPIIASVGGAAHLVRWERLTIQVGALLVGCALVMSDSVSATGVWAKRSGLLLVVTAMAFMALEMGGRFR